MRVIRPLAVGRFDVDRLLLSGVAGIGHDLKRDALPLAQVIEAIVGNSTAVKEDLFTLGVLGHHKPVVLDRWNTLHRSFWQQFSSSSECESWR